LNVEQQQAILLRVFLNTLILLLCFQELNAQTGSAVPIWSSWWFIAGMISLVLLLFFLFMRLRRKEMERRKADRIIDYFANSIYGDNSVSEICWDIARNCISQLKFEDCVVYLVDKDRKVLIQKAAYGPKNPRGHEIKNPIEIRIGDGIVGTVAMTGRAELIGDTTRDTRYIVDDVRRYSEIAVPILHDSRVIGVIDSEHSRKNFFHSDHLKAMTTIASISATKIAEAQAEAYARENEIKLLEINKQLAESQLMALRAQMNPHFVFNCLNSIQECIVTKKYGEASDYLNKFAKLFRMVLNNSGKQLVTLEEEMEVLRLYLDLELMRFEQSFSYGIEIDEQLEVEEIMIPSMLLQPFVENALWHGLMHKKEQRSLKISFRKLHEELFECTIDDNGIGRKKSFELKAGQNRNRHESKGLSITSDRVNLMKKQGYQANLEIIDKIDKTGDPAGTTVVIQLSTFLGN
jgi:putative methionine-R-sulfoxide reductase with GAF domain